MQCPLCCVCGIDSKMSPRWDLNVYLRTPQRYPPYPLPSNRWVVREHKYDVLIQWMPKTIIVDHWHCDICGYNIFPGTKSKHSALYKHPTKKFLIKERKPIIASFKCKIFEGIFQMNVKYTRKFLLSYNRSFCGIIGRA